MGAVCEVCSSYHMEGGAVVNDHRDKFENVDGDECSVFVVGFD